MWNFSHNHEKENLSKQNEDDQMVFFHHIPYISQNQHQIKEGLYDMGTMKKKLSEMDTLLLNFS